MASKASEYLYKVEAVGPQQHQIYFMERLIFLRIFSKEGMIKIISCDIY